MDNTNFTSKLSPMALVIGLCMSPFFAQASTPIEFDPDGSLGGLNTVGIGSFDWATGSVLIDDEIPLFAGERDVAADTAFHTVLAGVADINGNPRSLPGILNVDYEITLVTSTGVLIDVFDTSVLFRLDESRGENNVFEMYYDPVPDANPLDGTGFRDGHLILSGTLTELSGNFSRSTPLGTPSVDLENLDEFGTNNWPGVKTVSGEGGQNMAVLVQTVDKTFFPSGIDFGTILPFNNSQVVAFNQTNPSRRFDIIKEMNPGEGDWEWMITDANPGFVNGENGPDMLLQIDPNSAFEFLPPELACRVTGGGNDSGIFEGGTAGWSGTYAEDEITPLATNKNGKITGKSLTPYRYTMGGQAGANTAEQPQPKGEWTHTNHDGPGGLMFTFHAGTASAPDGTEIDEIICTDPGWCEQARPAPNKQIDFVGIGTFKNIKFKGNNTDSVVSAGLYNVVPEPNGNQPGEPTYHWFQVHIEDLGEPGNKQDEQGDGEPPLSCPDTGSGNDPFLDPPVIGNIADCRCADFYHIRIYEGVDEPEFDEDGNIININKDIVIYEVYGYINGGNFQIHPQTGFDLK